MIYQNWMKFWTVFGILAVVFEYESVKDQAIMKRFYKQAAASEGDDGLTVTLDGRALRTPAKAALALPSQALAEAIADEWNKQDETIDPTTMPMMRLAGTAIDRVMPQRDTVITGLATYAGSDLLCYRAEVPLALVAEQAKAWDPLLEWARTRHQLEFTVTAGIAPVRQPLGSLARVGDLLATYDAFTIAALHSATSATGSLVVGLALHDREIDAETAFTVSQIDEAFQTRQWGADPEAEAARQALRRDLADASVFFGLLPESP